MNRNKLTILIGVVCIIAVISMSLIGCSSNMTTQTTTTTNKPAATSSSTIIGTTTPVVGPIARVITAGPDENVWFTESNKKILGES